MRYEEKVSVAREKEAKIAEEYPTIAEAWKHCKYGGCCASCMYMKGTVQVNPYDIMDRIDMVHDYCMNMKRREVV